MSQEKPGAAGGLADSAGRTRDENENALDAAHNGDEPRGGPFPLLGMVADEVLMAIAERLTPRLDEVADRSAALYRREIPAYAQFPHEDLMAASRSIFAAFVTQLGHQTVATPESIDALRDVTHRRAEQGLPLEALTRAFQLGARVFLSAIDEETRELGIEDDVRLVLHDATWAWANEAAGVIAEAHRDYSVALARRDAARRADFLRGLLHGTLDQHTAAAEASVYGLSAELPYYVLRAHCTDAAAEAQLTEAVMRTGSTSTHRPVLAPLDGDLVGLSPERPRLEGTGLIATAPAATISDARQAFARATEALSTARAFGVTGVVELSDLGPLPLALASGPAAEALEHRHFDALDAQGRVGREIELTLRTVLELNQNLAAVSDALHVHRNTVRYRLARFRELTGLDVRQTQDFVTAWWLLNRRARETERRRPASR